MEKISKFLSYILRHNPGDIGLELNNEGWANISELIKKAPSKLNLTKTVVLEVVRTCDKQRYKLSPDNKRIRASQGHSFKVDLKLEATVPPDILYHGTATKSLTPIFETGLNSGKRQHVHLSMNLDTASAVGKRHGTLIILNVNAKLMVEEGYKFYLSDNNVWLTDTVPVRFLKIE